MSDLISRQEVSDIIKTRLYQTALNNDEYITSYAKACEDIAENRIDTWINEAKTVEPERKTGEWVEHERVEETYQGYLVSNYECDQCHEWVMNQSNYCPNCGAKMEVKK